MDCKYSGYKAQSSIDSLWYYDSYLILFEKLFTKALESLKFFWKNYLNLKYMMLVGLS